MDSNSTPRTGAERSLPSETVSPNPEAAWRPPARVSLEEIVNAARETPASAGEGILRVAPGWVRRATSSVAAWLS